MPEKLHIPVSARYTFVDGKLVKVGGEYIDVEPEVFGRVMAEMLLNAFGVPWERKEERGEPNELATDGRKPAGPDL